MYSQTIGPRFETKAEVRFLAAFSDVVGMTAAHEADFCNEHGLPYALLCMVDNAANGLDANKPQLELEDVRALAPELISCMHSFLFPF